MRKKNNFLSDSMAQIEYYVNEAANDLMNIDLVEGEDNTFVYDVDRHFDVFKWINEDAIIDFFEDFLSEEINTNKKKYGVEGEIFIEDGSLIIKFPCY